MLFVGMIHGYMYKGFPIRSALILIQQINFLSKTSFFENLVLKVSASGVGRGAVAMTSNVQIIFFFEEIISNIPSRR